MIPHTAEAAAQVSGTQGPLPPEALGAPPKDGSLPLAFVPLPPVAASASEAPAPPCSLLSPPTELCE